MVDSTTSEGYVALRNALVATREDASAVRSILSSTSDGGQGWAATAHLELRRLLLLGRLNEASTIGQLIGHVLALNEPEPEPDSEELSALRLHREGMEALEAGIGAVLARDNRTGIRHLEVLADAVYGDPSLRWVALFWLARAAADDGNLEQAMKAGMNALTIARGLDRGTHGRSLCRLADVEFLREEYDGALEHVLHAARLFEEIGDGRGLATARLALARMLDEMGRTGEALESAAAAQEADPDWEDPAIYLSQRALAGDALGLAEQVLEPFLAEPRSSEVDRQVRLVSAVRDGHVRRQVAVDLVKLRGQPASSASVEALERLWSEHRDFLELREVLAWHLVKIGREQEAAAHFGEMAGAELAPELQSSVMLGLGCLANRQYQHLQPGARVHAASEAFARVAERRPSENLLETVPVEPPETADSDDFEFDPAALDDAMDLLTAHEETDLTPPPPKPPSEVIQAVVTQPLVKPPSETRPGGVSKARAVFTGSLQLFAVPDLLDFLSTSRRTGTLVITSDRGIGAIHMREGYIAGAAAPNSASMGDLLVQGEALSQESLDQAVARQHGEGGGRMLGAILLEMGLVDNGKLRVALEKQAKGALREMVEWTDGRFAFEPDRNGDHVPGEVELNLDTRSVLLDVLREFDEDNK